jgi:predicted nucleotidyltransferase
MSSRLPIPLPSEAIAGFCRKHHIRKLALFGSALRDDFGPNSNLDILVEFEQGHVPGLRFFAIQDELSEILGRRVHLNTSQDLSVYYRDRVLAEAEPLYVAA